MLRAERGSLPSAATPPLAVLLSMERKRRAKMNERETECWALFENRPAKERTSCISADAAEGGRGWHEARAGLRIQRHDATKTVPEHGKC